MGSSIKIKITPYIKVNGDRTRIIKNEKRTCPKHPDDRTLSGDTFCRKCGSKIETVQFEEKEKLDPLSFLLDNGIDDDSLYLPDYMGENILIPNSYPVKDIKISDGENNAIDLVDPNTLRDEQISWMEKKYSKEIKLLKQEFGESNIVLCWGLISYWA